MVIPSEDQMTIGFTACSVQSGSGLTWPSNLVGTAQNTQGIDLRSLGSQSLSFLLLSRSLGTKIKIVIKTSTRMILNDFQGCQVNIFKRFLYRNSYRVFYRVPADIFEMKVASFYSGQNGSLFSRP